ncbi:MAG: ComF family protein [Ferruginibacter sp.]
MTALQNLFSSACHLFYPHICKGCGSDLLGNDDLLCTQCMESLPFTGYENYPHNPIERIFYGRLPVETATSGFYFVKGGLIQHLVHGLKYKGDKEIGIFLGTLMGNRLFESRRFETVDYLIPLPLFADKEFKRGFNQAEVICDGLSSAMNIPVLPGNVIRSHFTETQTKKHRAERWENVSGSFKVTDPGALQNKHILLVDDVITTGATLEACACAISEAGDVRVSLATLATATK